MPKFVVTFKPIEISVEASNYWLATDEARKIISKSPPSKYFQAKKVARTLQEILKSEVRDFTPEEQSLLDAYNAKVSAEAERIASKNSSPRVCKIK